jgi:hypothetical protein
MLHDTVPAFFAESVTVPLKLETPDAVGVPLTSPDEAVKLRPAGKDPLEIE